MVLLILFRQNFVTNPDKIKGNHDQRLAHAKKEIVLLDSYRVSHSISEKFYFYNPNAIKFKKHGFSIGTISQKNKAL
jgi:hypothetical protein